MKTFAGNNQLSFKCFQVCGSSYSCFWWISFIFLILDILMLSFKSRMFILVCAKWMRLIAVMFCREIRSDAEQFLCLDLEQFIHCVAHSVNALSCCKLKKYPKSSKKNPGSNSIWPYNSKRCCWNAVEETVPIRFLSFVASSSSSNKNTSSICSSQLLCPLKPLYVLHCANIQYTSKSSLIKNGGFENQSPPLSFSFY